MHVKGYDIKVTCAYCYQSCVTELSDRENCAIDTSIIINDISK